MLHFLKAELVYYRSYVVLLVLAHLFNISIIIATDFSADFLAIWFIFPFIISAHLLGQEYLKTRLTAFVLLPFSIRRIAAMRMSFILLMQIGIWLALIILAIPFLDLSRDLILGLLSLIGAITGLVMANVIGCDLKAYASKGGRASRLTLILAVAALFLFFASAAILESSRLQYNDIILLLKSGTGVAIATIFCLAAILLSFVTFIHRSSFLK